MVGAGQATRRQNQSKLLAVFCRHEMCRRGRRQCARKRGMYTDNISSNIKAVYL